MDRKQANGFTLIELLVALLLMGLIVNLATFSVRTVFNANVTAHASQFASALRATRDQTLATKKEDYKVILKYDTAKQMHYYEVHKPGSVETVDIPQNISISKNTYDAGKNIIKTNVGFKFDKVTGVVENGASVGITYCFTNTSTSATCNVHVAAKTGSVIIDE